MTEPPWNRRAFAFLGAFTYALDSFSLLMRIIHQSSHLGDEFLLHNEVERRNLCFEELDPVGESGYRVDFLLRDCGGRSPNGQVFARRIQTLGPNVQLYF